MRERGRASDQGRACEQGRASDRASKGERERASKGLSERERKRSEGLVITWIGDCIRNKLRNMGHR